MSTDSSRASIAPPTPNIKLQFLKDITTNLKFFMRPKIFRNFTVPKERTANTLGNVHGALRKLQHENKFCPKIIKY